MINIVIWFVFGTIFGSFLNVLSARYIPEKRIFHFSRLLGRSHCPQCRNKLTWIELIPVLSFLVLRGKCRTCKKRISVHYPIIEIMSGISFVVIPMSVPNAFTAFSFIPITINIWLVAMVGLFLFASLTLIFLSAVDARLTIIPDESNLLIAAIGIIVAGIAHFQSLFSNFSGSFIGHYALLFGPRENIFLNRGIAIIIMILFFGTIIILSRGRGMGMGDLKLAAAASLLIGWPDIMVAVVLAFIIGALFSILLIVRGRKKMKSIIPFGPFIALGILLVIFAGEYIMNGYFYLFP